MLSKRKNSFLAVGQLVNQVRLHGTENSFLIEAGFNQRQNKRSAQKVTKKTEISTLNQKFVSFIWIQNGSITSVVVGLSKAFQRLSQFRRLTMFKFKVRVSDGFGEQLAIAWQ